MFKFLEGLRSGQSEMWATLEHLSLSRTPVRVEIENSLEHFMSHVAIRDGQVMIARPSRPTLDLNPGSHIRARLPGEERRELRLEVVVSRMNYGKGGTAFICKPSRRQVPTRRSDDRYSVRRFKNLRLAVAEERFRIVDISRSGCKLILNSSKSVEHLPMGETIFAADVNVGSRISIRLSLLIPRSRQGRTMGCQFEISPDGASDQYMERLIASLDRKENDRRVTPGERRRPSA